MKNTLQFSSAVLSPLPPACAHLADLICNPTDVDPDL